MSLTKAQIAKAAKLSQKELEMINVAAERLIGEEVRPIVLVAAAAHLIGTFIRTSDGLFTKKSAMRLVETLIQL